MSDRFFILFPKGFRHSPVHGLQDGVEADEIIHGGKGPEHDRIGNAMQVQQATQARAPHYTYWDAMRMRKASELKRNHASVECFRLKLALAVNKANKLCVMGRSLSYSAKVEAVYGGEQANALKQVSEQVEGAICGILGTLAKLDRQLGMAA